MGYVIAALAVAGAVTGYMASQEATGNANDQAAANFLNQDHQKRLQIQQQNDQQIRNYQRQTLQNLYIGKAATRQKIANKTSLNRSSRAQFIALNESNKASYALLQISNTSRNIGSNSGTSRALQRQAFRNWQRSASNMQYNVGQQHAQIEGQYQNTLNKMGSNEYLMNSYIGGAPPQMMAGGWSAIAAGVSGGIGGAAAGSGMMNA